MFDGVRAAAGRASLLRPTDAVVGEVRNAAVPPPPGPNGTIFEALGRPTLVRTHQGQPVGRTLDLEWHGSRVGAIGMQVESAVFWSGTHFLYPFRSSRGANLLPIDCAP